MGEISRRDDPFRHGARLSKGAFHWSKDWYEEWVPAWRYACHLGLPPQTRLKLAPESAPAVDVYLELEEREIQLEITMAYDASHPAWRSGGHASPGAQDALRAEMLNQDGFAPCHTPLVRNPRTRRVEPAEEEIARPVSDTIDAWVEGINLAAKQKRRSGYGAGSTLLIYGYGLCGDFSPHAELISFDLLMQRLNKSHFDNGFDATFVLSWEVGWCGRIVV